ncbi:MAG: hypothetical protein ACOCU1_00925 [Bacillota bacterium]
MKKYEIISLIVLYATFAIVLVLMGVPSFYLGLFEEIIIGVFYLLGFGVPLYFFILFIIKRTIRAFKYVIIASIPMITFIMIMIILLIRLGEALEHF